MLTKVFYEILPAQFINVGLGIDETEANSIYAEAISAGLIDHFNFATNYDYQLDIDISFRTAYASVKF